MSIDKAKLNEIKKKPPVYIVGCQRSGTSFSYRTLSEILDIGFGRDNKLFLTLYQNLAKFGNLVQDNNLKKLLNTIANSRDFRKRFNGLDILDDDFISCLEKRQYADIVRSIYAYWAMKQGKIRWGGKTPDYTGYMDLLIDFFPDIKIIHIVRDGRDVALSFYNLPWGPKDAYVAAVYWKKRVDLGSNGKRYTNKRFIEIKYEDLLEIPEQVFKRLLNFLDFSELENKKRILEFRKNIIPKIKKNNTYKWKSKMRQRDVRVFELTAGEQLERYGYEMLNKDFQKYDLSAVRRGYHYGKNAFIKGIKGYLFRTIYKRLLR